MAESGNPGQWGTHFPPEDLLRADIEEGRLYVVEAGRRVHGVFAFIVGSDETYAVIEDGGWLSGGAYGTIHHVASDGEVPGIFGAVVSFCWGKKNHLRIDTHEKNAVMRHLIEKNGFLRCGIIHVADGTPRIAYERI